MIYEHPCGSFAYSAILCSFSTILLDATRTSVIHSRMWSCLHKIYPPILTIPVIEHLLFSPVLDLSIMPLTALPRQVVSSFELSLDFSGTSLSSQPRFCSIDPWFLLLFVVAIFAHDFEVFNLSHLDSTHRLLTLCSSVNIRSVWSASHSLAGLNPVTVSDSLLECVYLTMQRTIDILGEFTQKMSYWLRNLLTFVCLIITQHVIGRMFAKVKSNFSQLPANEWKFVRRMLEMQT